MSQFSFLDIDEPAESTPLLRERTFGQMWNETWDIFSAHWRRWLVLGVIALGPPMLFNLLVFSEADTLQTVTDDLLTPAGYISIGAMVDLFAPIALRAALGWAYTLIVLNGAGSIMTAHALAGEPVSLRTALGTMLSQRVGALIGGNLLVWGTAIGLFLLAVIMQACLVSWLVLIFMLYMLVAWLPMLNPLLVLERGPLGRLLSRAWFFGRRRIWVIVAVLLSLGAVTYMASLPVALLRDQVLGPLVTFSFEEGLVLAESYRLWQAVLALINLLAQSIILPIGVILYTLLYYDARARLDYPDDGRIALGDPPYPPQPWLVPRDLANMLGLAVLLVALLAALVLSSGLLARM